MPARLHHGPSVPQAAGSVRPRQVARPAVASTATASGDSTCRDLTCWVGGGRRCALSHARTLAGSTRSARSGNRSCLAMDSWLKHPGVHSASALSAIEWTSWGPYPAAPPGKAGTQNEYEDEEDDDRRDYRRAVTHCLYVASAVNDLPLSRERRPRLPRIGSTPPRRSTAAAACSRHRSLRSMGAQQFAREPRLHQPRGTVTRTQFRSPRASPWQSLRTPNHESGTTPLRSRAVESLI